MKQHRKYENRETMKKDEVIFYFFYFYIRIFRVYLCCVQFEVENNLKRSPVYDRVNPYRQTSSFMRLFSQEKAFVICSNT